MKKYILIMTAVLGMVSCSKFESVQPVQETEIEQPTLTRTLIADSLFVFETSTNEYEYRVPLFDTLEYFSNNTVTAHTSSGSEFVFNVEYVGDTEQWYHPSGAAGQKYIIRDMGNEVRMYHYGNPTWNIERMTFTNYTKK